VVLKEGRLSYITQCSNLNHLESLKTRDEKFPDKNKFHLWMATPASPSLFPALWISDLSSQASQLCKQIPYNK
jgi:hypothetical protein